MHALFVALWCFVPGPCSMPVNLNDLLVFSVSLASETPPAAVGPVLALFLGLLFTGFSKRLGHQKRAFAV